MQLRQEAGIQTAVYYHTQEIAQGDRRSVQGALEWEQAEVWGTLVAM